MGKTQLPCAVMAIERPQSLGVYETRGRLRPTPNGNEPGDVPPATVGDDVADGGEPNAVEICGEFGSPRATRIVPSSWAGWPDCWDTPLWGQGRLGELVDTAWAGLDLNARVLSTMPLYAVRDDDTLAPLPSWGRNPDPDMYSSWAEFAKQLFWDFQGCGEAFVLATARDDNGRPARFRVVPGWLVNAELVGGLRRYSIGGLDVTDDMLHLRYNSTTDDARGHGPLEAGRTRLISAGVLARYAMEFARGGGVPYYVITTPEELTDQETNRLLDQWWQSRLGRSGQPGILSGGLTLTPMQTSPKDMALVELEQVNDTGIARLLGVPSVLLDLPSGGNSMTYKTEEGLFIFHWRAGLRPQAEPVMQGLSQWAMPAEERVELNRDAYVEPGPYERAQTWQILHDLKVLTSAGIAKIERLYVDPSSSTDPTSVPVGVL